MTNRFISSICSVCFLIFVVLISCSSTKNRTEERAKERVIQFIRLMTEDQIEEAEKLLSRQLEVDEQKELFLNAYYNWQLRDTSTVIEVHNITFPIEEEKNKASASITVHNEKTGFTKMGSVPIKFERGDWYIGG